MIRASTCVAVSLSLTACLGAGEINVETSELPPPPAPTEDAYAFPLPPDEGGLGLPPTDDRLKGAGGRDLTEFWDPIQVPYSNNVKMLGFDMMKAEVKRATGLSWMVGGIDQWEQNRAAFGGANYQTTFNEDLTPSPQKLLLWRKMAYAVCADAVAKDAGKATRALFTEVDPAVAISTSNAAVNAQVDALYVRFFFEAPDAAIRMRAGTLLAAAYADGMDSKEAWRALCVGYLASMKFLSY